MTLCRIIALVASALALTGVRAECKVRPCGPAFPSLAAGSCGATPCPPPPSSSDATPVVAPTTLTSVDVLLPFAHEASLGFARAFVPSAYDHGYRTSGASPPRVS